MEMETVIARYLVTFIVELNILQFTSDVILILSVHFYIEIRYCIDEYMLTDTYTSCHTFHMLSSIMLFLLLNVERRNNFPPLPGWFPVKPCFYQDFDVEIPVEFQHLVRSVYRLWQGN